MFTAPARDAIAHAQDEARDLGHQTVQIEHLLLGLFSDHDGIASGVLADFGLTAAPVRRLVRERLGGGSGSLAGGKVPFSPEAKDALRSANMIGMGEPGTEHMLIVLVRRGEGGACDILRALGVDPHQVRFETKKRVWPSSFSQPGTRTRGEVRLVRSVPAESIRELDFEE